MQLAITVWWDSDTHSRSIDTYVDKDTGRDKDFDVDMQVPMDVKEIIQVNIKETHVGDSRREENPYP